MSDVVKPVQDELLATASPEELERVEHELPDLTRQQKQLRTKITTTITAAQELIAARGSRRGVQNYLDLARKHLVEAEALNDAICKIVVVQAAVAIQHKRHLKYVNDVNTLADEVDDYLAGRAGDAASVVSVAAAPMQQPQLPSQPASSSGGSVRSQQQRLDAAAVQQALDAARQREEEARRLRQAAEDALKILLDDETFHEARSHPSAPSVNHRVNQWINQQKQSAHPAIIEEEVDPDDWIDAYVNGEEHSFDDLSAELLPSSAPLPEAFSGRALDWFPFAEQFYATVHHTRKSIPEKLRLLKLLTKGAHEHLIIGAGEKAYKDGLRSLKQEAGKREVMKIALEKELKAIEVRRDPAGFKKSALALRTYLFELSRVGETQNLHLIDYICQKLHPNDVRDWNEGRSQGLDRRTLNEFGEWLCRRAESYQTISSIAEAQSSITASKAGPSSNRFGSSSSRFKGTSERSGRAHAAAGGSSSGPTPVIAGAKQTEGKSPFCFKCETRSHRLRECPQFEKMTVEQRQEFCIGHNLCFICFYPYHDARSCSRKKTCGIGPCNLLHDRMLHLSITGSSSTATFHKNAALPSRVALGMIRVDAFDADGLRVPANIMIDEGSNITLVREGFARRLQVRGVAHTLTINGVCGSRNQAESQLVRLQLQGADGEQVHIQGSTTPTVASPVRAIPWDQMKTQWSHLADLPLTPTGGAIDILLGLDNSHLTALRGYRTGKDMEPYALLTKLGWVARGVLGNDIHSQPVSCFHARMDVGVEDFGPEIATLLRVFCDTESFGTEHQKDCLSAENQRAVQQLESGTVKLDVGYQVPILWREGEPSLLDNRALATNRNLSLQNRFRKDPAFETAYRKAMQKNFDQGYAIRLSDSELTSPRPAYYLPHFGVCKGDKVRIVFDAAAKSRGRCLNDSICSGPALQNPLPSVLIRFREGEVAWMGDIEAMFSRIRLHPDDQRYQRFLWTEPDGTTSTCQMTRVAFGVNCSPFVAIRTTWRAAEDAGEEKKEAAEVIKRGAYVDDILDSAETAEDAIRRAKMTREVLAAGDFHLPIIMSNSQQVMEALNSVRPGSSNPEAQVSIGENDVEAVLGISWWPGRDTLGFRVSGLQDVTFTRLGLVSKLASVFDPNCTAAPMTVKGKIRLRHLGTRGLEWHDKVEGEDLDWWRSWFQIMMQLKYIQQPRCLYPREKQILRTELHTFADASEEAYAAVCYVRVIYQDGNIIIRHVKAATKLAPIKTISVQKLELNAALLGARTARFVESSLRRPVDERFFWTDSSTVRNWVRAVAPYYVTFVSVRIGEIQTLTEAREWRFVPGRLNPSDAATRSELESEALPYSWLYGPPFLYSDPSTWPKDLPWMAEPEGLRSAHVFHVAVPDPFDWEKVSITAKCIPTLVRLTGEYLELLKRCQAEAFAEDVERLQRGKSIRPSSRLLACTPMIGPDGLLRVGGRLEKAKLPYSAVHPVLLPGHHPLTKKIVTAFHERLLHAGTDFILSHIRQHLWITGGREAVKRARKNCQYCIRQQAKPMSQLMGALPSCRLALGAPPFNQCACDYFGPMEVGYARNRITKRWGCIFTCLTTRLMYVDVAESLSADDFILLFRRFIAVYGKPQDMYSDNGTNFVGAERELREEVEQLHKSEKAQQFIQTEAIKWHFQPARSPHFGGAHESLVKTVKRALYAALAVEKKGLRYPSGPLLQTLLFEVAGLLNCRPLTYASSDLSDLRPLTPNDFINRPPVVDIPAGDFKRALPRDGYRYVQKMTNLVWDQFKGPFLQSMMERSKWKTKEDNLEVGDYVMEVRDDLKRGEWPSGRVSAVYPGADGLVRVVDVQLPTGSFRRGITEICLLERGSAGSDPASQPASGENAPAISHPPSGGASGN